MRSHGACHRIHRLAQRDRIGIRSLLSVSENKNLKVSVILQVVADKKKYPDPLRPFFLLRMRSTLDERILQMTQQKVILHLCCCADWFEISARHRVSNTSPTLQIFSVCALVKIFPRSRRLKTCC